MPANISFSVCPVHLQQVQEDAPSRIQMFLSEFNHRHQKVTVESEVSCFAALLYDRVVTIAVWLLSSTHDDA